MVQQTRRNFRSDPVLCCLSLLLHLCARVHKWASVSCEISASPQEWLNRREDFVSFHILYVLRMPARWPLGGARCRNELGVLGSDATVYELDCCYCCSVVVLFLQISNGWSFLLAFECEMWLSYCTAHGQVLLIDWSNQSWRWKGFYIVFFYFAFSDVRHFDVNGCCWIKWSQKLKEYDISIFYSYTNRDENVQGQSPIKNYHF